MKTTFVFNFNLDNPVELEFVMIEYDIKFGARGRHLANNLSFKGKGSTKAANSIANYCWNKHIANFFRLAGNIQTAQQYESICDRIYADMPESIRW